jgi:cobalt/nickel transport system permease protein
VRAGFLCHFHPGAHLPGWWVAGTGANILNMGVVGVAVSYMVYKTTLRLARGHSWGIFAGGFAAAWFSVEVSALGTALELALSGPSPANIAIPAMGGIHAMIGTGEGLITIGALAFLHSSRSGLLKTNHANPVRGNLVWVIGLILALLLAIASPWASGHPDGLMSVARQYGFLSSEQNPFFTLLPHYLVPGVKDKTLATILAAIFGTLVVFIAVLGVAYSRHHQKNSEKD